MLAAALRVVGGGDAELQSRMQAVQPVVEAHLCGTRVDFGFLLNGSQKQNFGQLNEPCSRLPFLRLNTTASVLRGAMVELGHTHALSV